MGRRVEERWGDGGMGGRGDGEKDRKKDGRMGRRGEMNSTEIRIEHSKS